MEGNMSMANHLMNETEEQNNFWADVYYYMEENNCDKETAMKAIEPLYTKK
ncbi:hypothetical protein ACDN41_12395 [Priestia aryabhattai]|uniref:hypothetical protein n=1 Tax=Priestia aryabhattai TaxID=412384 RepID=UPI003531D061